MHYFTVTLCAISAFVAQSIFAVTVTTNPVGVYSITCPGESDTYVTVPVYRDPAFVGAVDSVATVDGVTTITVSGEPGFTNNQFVYGTDSNTDHFYVRFSSGTLEGAWYNVEANGSYTLQIEIGAAEASAIAQGDTFLLIPHWTLNTIMPAGKGTNASTRISAPGRSKVMFGNADSAGTNLGYKNSYYYYSTSSGAANWADSLNSGQTACANDVIYPDQYFVLRNDGSSYGTTLTFSGNVLMSKNSILLKNLSATGQQDNLVSLPSCVPITLSQLTAELITSDNFFKPSTRVSSPAGGDYLIVYPETAAKNKNPAATYYYNNGNWYKGSGVLANTDIIPSNSAVIIRRASRGEVVAVRKSFTPEYLK